MLDVALAAMGALAVVLAVVSRPLRNAPASEPLAGLLLGVLLGPALLGLVVIPADQHAEVLGLAARLLLAMSLMAVALRYPQATIARQWRPVLLLLVVVMPVMAGVAAALGHWVLGLPAAAAWLLGAALAPTDPILASSVVVGEPAERDLPERLRVMLSTESGANDGLVFPLVLLGLVLVADDPLTSWTGQVVVKLAVGVVLGVLLGGAAGWVIRWAHARHEIESSALLVVTLALALLVLGAVRLAGGQDLVAVFVAGLAYNRFATGAERGPEQQIEEGVNRLLVVPAFTLFGVVLPWQAWGRLGWRAVVFVAALLLLRRLPAVLALRRPLALGQPEASFLGWFGPIGLAALFYLTEAARHGAHPLVWAAGTLAVAASTLAHGSTSAPGRVRYARVTQQPRSPTA